MNLKNIINILNVLVQKAEVWDSLPATITISHEEFEEFRKVVAMLQFAELLNYKKAQDAVPRLLNVLKLIKAINDNPPSANPDDVVILSPKTRAQLDRALEFAEK